MGVQGVRDSLDGQFGSRIVVCHIKIICLDTLLKCKSNDRLLMVYDTYFDSEIDD